MANKTAFLGLILPGNNEYTNVWDGPINDNFGAVDAWAEATENELQEARGSHSSLAGRLAVGMENNGTLKPSTEVIRTRNSKVYGADNGSGTDYLLYDHIDFLDMELYRSRMWSPNLRAGLAQYGKDFGRPDSIYDGFKTPSGQPNFLTASGVEFQINAAAVNLVLNIDGYVLRVRKGVNVPVSGADGTKYLVAQKPVSDVVVLDRSTQEAGTIAQNTGNNNKLQILRDASIDFTTQDVKQGDIVELLNTNSLGRYIVAAIAPDGDINSILIYGVFPASASSINYKIYDPLAPVLTVEDSRVEAPGKCYIGQAIYASAGGGSLTSAKTYAFRGKYESEWRSVNAGAGFFTEVFNHNLGGIPKKITFLASQSNDDSGDVELLTVAELDNTLLLNINNTLTHTPGTLSFTPPTFTPESGSGDSFTPGSASFAGGSLTGSVTGTLSGDVAMKRSVKTFFNKLDITVKNLVSTLFYKDFNGVGHTSGYLKVICEK